MASTLQFSKKYTPTKTGPKDDALFCPKEFNEIDGGVADFYKLDFIITDDFEDECKQVVKFLPIYIKTRLRFEVFSLEKLWTFD